MGTVVNSIAHFYNTDDASALKLRRVQEVRCPSNKALCPCFASTPGCVYDDSPNTPSGGHGTHGMSLLFVDGHSEFAAYSRLNAPYVNNGVKIYNLDWTIGGLSGQDLMK